MPRLYSNAALSCLKCAIGQQNNAVYGYCYLRGNLRPIWIRGALFFLCVPATHTLQETATGTQISLVTSRKYPCQQPEKGT